MRNFVVGGVLVCSGLIGGAFAQSSVEQHFSLRPISSYDDAAQCARDGGRGALVVDLDQHGGAIGEFTSNCLLDAK